MSRGSRKLRRKPDGTSAIRECVSQQPPVATGISSLKLGREGYRVNLGLKGRLRARGSVKTHIGSSGTRAVRV